jgi:hypothetical protein
MQAQCEEKDEWSDWEKRHRWIRAGLSDSGSEPVSTAGDDCGLVKQPS